jgi:hypothetical protein
VVRLRTGRVRLRPYRTTTRHDATAWRCVLLAVWR